MRGLIIAVILAVMLPMSAVGSIATDVMAIFVDTVIVADTIANAVNSDTVYSPAFRMDNRFFTFYQKVEDALLYGASIIRTTDTFFFSLQHTFDLINWITVAAELDTLTAVGQDTSSVILDRDASILGSWGRLRVIYWDDAEADKPDSLGNVRAAKLKLYISGN